MIPQIEVCSMYFCCKTMFVILEIVCTIVIANFHFKSLKCRGFKRTAASSLNSFLLRLYWGMRKGDEILKIVTSWREQRGD